MHALPFDDILNKSRREKAEKPQQYYCRDADGGLLMPTNFQLTRDWISMALADWKIAHSAQRDSNFGPCVYHLQQFAEKLTKAAICLFGEEPEPIHFPSKQLRRLQDQKAIIISDEIQKIIVQISALAITLEDERTRPRYGVRHKDRIVPPQEYYSEDIIHLFLEDVKAIASATLKLLMAISEADFEDEIDILKEMIE